MKECVVDIHNMLCISFFFFFSNVLWVRNIGMNIDICKNQNNNNNNYSEISHAHNVRQSLLHTYNITNNKNKNGK